jgi:microcystin-dependent protein
MAMVFPTSPTVGQVFSSGGRSWVWNGAAWDSPSAANIFFFVPAGQITQYAGSAAPSGYLLCTGQSISTTAFPELFAVIGYTYGGSGANFNVPNLQNRVPVGKGPDAEFDTLGETGGAKTHTLTIAEMPSHNHSTQIIAKAFTSALDGLSGGTVNNNAQSYPSSSTGGGGAHNNLQPYIVLNYIIKT